ncbi:universal stress protein [Cupriavidus sp. 2TAF22]|uniref:universal stress protein n=1 Tax=unclassified Cupriavidus TaxID=2640874 RepID=UPI003F93AD26
MMEYKSLLVELGPDPGCADRVRLAAGLAQRSAAHVTGLTATGMRLEPFRGAGDDAGRYAELARRQLLAQGAAAGADFHRVMQETAPAVSCAHRVVEEDTGWALAREGRLADLIVLARLAGPEALPVLVAQTAEYVMLEAGRPVLLVPPGVRSLSCGHIAIAWDGGREAARAVADAMPLLREAARVTVVSATGADAGVLQPPATAEALCAHLARHGIAASVHAVSGSQRPGPLLLEAVGTLQADLLVAGGYGHARLRELVTGGTTRTLMRQADIPVFMSH